MQSILRRAGWALAGALAIGVIAVAARGAHGGPLDPPGTPGPTMLSLDHLPPDWMLKLSAANGCSSQRFECVMLRVICNPNCHFNFEGVLDHETGLVWQRDLTGTQTGRTWSQAVTDCLNFQGGAKYGWRLPTMAEAASLIDPNVVGPAVSFPPGAPFINVPSVPWYWTATQDFSNGNGRDVFAVYYLSGNGTPGFVIADSVGGSPYGAMCVRGAE
jgi:hypothetical protein